MTTLAASDHAAAPAAPRRASAPQRRMQQRPGTRDTSVDAVRALCLVVVVALHATMVGVSVGPHGVVIENALEHQPWFAPVSWFVQVMPLFFIAGGFSGITQWRRMRANGASASDYVRSRLVRLLRPAVVMVAAVGVGLALLTMVGLPADLVATAGFRISQPLWFLAVYLGCSALVPLMVRAHERARLATSAVLLAGVVAVDVVRIASDAPAVGLVNLALVWLLIQQFGFWLADGQLDRLRTRTRVVLAAAASVLLFVITAVGLYSPDMYVNLNPPTLCLVVLGSVQLFVFSVAQQPIRTWMLVPRVHAAVNAIGSRSMTIYLWHMSVLVALAGLLLLVAVGSGRPLPDPLSAAWWMTRPMWLLAVGAAVVVVVCALSQYETARPSASASTRAPRFRSLITAVLLGIVAVTILLAIGFTATTALVSVALMLGAIRLAERSTSAARADAEHRTRSMLHVLRRQRPVNPGERLA